MFDKLKQLKELNDLRNSMALEKVEAEKNGVRIVINGKMEIEKVTINPLLDNTNQEIALRECFNEAMKKIQSLMASKMSHLIGG